MVTTRAALVSLAGACASGLGFDSSPAEPPSTPPAIPSSAGAVGLPKNVLLALLVVVMPVTLRTELAGQVLQRAESEEASIQLIMTMYRDPADRGWAVTTVGAYAAGATAGLSFGAALGGDLPLSSRIDDCFMWSMEAYAEFILRDWNGRPEIWASDWRTALITQLVQFFQNGCRR